MVTELFQEWKLSRIYFAQQQENNQPKCGKYEENLVMRADDDERKINYEWPYP